MTEICIRDGLAEEANVHVTAVHLDMWRGHGRVLEYRRDAQASWAIPIATVEQRADGFYWLRAIGHEHGPFPTADAAGESAYLWVERGLDVNP